MAHAPKKVGLALARLIAQCNTEPMELEHGIRHVARSVPQQADHKDRANAALPRRSIFIIWRKRFRFLTSRDCKSLVVRDYAQTQSGTPFAERANVSSCSSQPIFKSSGDIMSIRALISIPGLLSETLLRTAYRLPYSFVHEAARCLEQFLLHRVFPQRSLCAVPIPRRFGRDRTGRSRHSFS
jgi:hypothetical protein